MSDSNQAELIYVKNVADVMPVDSTAWRSFRIAGADGLSSTPSTTQSNETRTDRNRTDVILTSRETGGSVPGEFSADTYDEFLEACFQSAFAAGVMVNGTTKQSFTFLRRFNDFNTVKRIRYDKVRVDGFNLDFSFSNIVTTGLALVGAGVDGDAVDPVGTGSVQAAYTTTAMSAVDISNVTLGGISTGLCVESGSLAFTNNHRRRNCVENGADPTDNTTGSFNATASLRVYNGDTSFPLHAIKNDQTAVGFSFDLSDGTTTYTFNMPRCFLSFADASGQGLDTDVMLDITLTATFDSGIGGTVEITKA